MTVIIPQALYLEFKQKAHSDLWNKKQLNQKKKNKMDCHPADSQPPPPTLTDCCDSGEFAVNTAVKSGVLPSITISPPSSFSSGLSSEEEIFPVYSV